MKRWLAGLSVYLQPRVLAILFLGFSAGLPLALVGSTLQAWLKEEGISRTAVGFFAMVGVPYNLKFLWAPMIDALRIPVLSRRLGRRRAWLVTTQALLMAAVVALGFVRPADHVLLFASVALLVAFCSASQDIVIDAFRIESLERPQYAAGMANYVLGYRLAMLASGAGALFLASYFQESGLAGNAAWAPTYAVMAALVLIGVTTVLLSGEPAAPEEAAPRERSLPARFAEAVIKPFSDFALRRGWLLILIFVLLFKFGDAFAGNMTVYFVLDIGFDKTDYAWVVKVFGLAAVLVGGFLGGYLQRVAGTLTSLWIAGVAQMASNLMFVWQAKAGPQLSVLILTIGVENLAGGLGTVVFVAYLSGLCRNQAYTATQYALLSALAAVGRTVLSSPAGWFSDRLGWVLFFWLTTVAAVPGLLLLVVLTRRGLLASDEESAM